MHEVLFRIHLFGHERAFYSYGFLMGWSFFLAAQLAMYLAEKEGIPRAKSARFAIGVIACGLVGGRLHAIVADPTMTWRDAFGGHGFVFYGAALSGIFAAWPVAWLLKIDVGTMVDAAGAGIPLAHGIGRVGCFLAGCCYGAPVPKGWEWLGVRFPSGSPACNVHESLGLVVKGAPFSLPVWPTQLMESAFELTMAALLTFYFLRRPPRKGDVMLRYLLCYGIWRASIELIRGDPERGTMLGLSTSTTIGLICIGFSLAMMFSPLKNVRPSRGPLPAPEPVPGGAATA